MSRLHTPPDPNSKRSKRRQERRERMRAMLESFENYVVTYRSQEGWEDYSDKMFLDDMLYGLGIAMEDSDEQYTWGNGFQRFKEYLLKHLGAEKTFFGAWVKAKEEDNV